MRERLARVTDAVAAAATRRTGVTGELADVVKALQNDYPSTADDDDERFLGVSAVFGLPTPAADLLTVAVAPGLDPTVGHAFDLLSGRLLGGHVTVGLALELAGLPTAGLDSSRHLHPTAPLRRGGLVELVGAGGWLDRQISVHDRVRAHLTGDDVADAAVLSVAVDALAYRCPTSDQMARALTEGQRLVWVNSPLGRAGLSVAVAAFADAGADCLVIDARLARSADLADVVRAAVREAGLRGVGLVVGGADEVVRAGAPVVRLLAGSPVPVIAVGTAPWPAHLLPTSPLTVAAPFLTGADRAAIWESAMDGPLEGTAAKSIVHLRLNPEEILATTRYARLLAQARGEEVTHELLRDAARTLGSRAATTLTVGQVARDPGTAASFADLVLPARIKDELVRLVRWAERRDEILTRSTLHTKGGKGGGLAALFTGSPGTGKTLSAHVIANELGLELMQIDLSAIVDKYIGETEKHLEQVFRDAESRNVVLFFDEADALFGSRSAVQDAHDRYANQGVSYLLQRMEHFDGITVLATNLGGNLDRAFLRRMQFIIPFPDPDPDTRRRLWQVHLDQAGETDLDDPVDVDALVEAIDLAGGDVRNIVLAAAYDAVVAGRPVGHRIVVAAAVREYQKLGRRPPSFL